MLILIHQIFEKENEIKNILTKIDSKNEDGSPMISETLIKEMVMNLNYKPKGRRYSIPHFRGVFKDICFVIMYYSPKSANIIFK